MTAQEFYNAFIHSLDNENITKDYIKKEYENDGRWTKRITKIVCDIIEKAGLKPEKEFYRIDYIGWKERKNSIWEKAGLVEMIPCLWDLKVAVEHENKQDDWTYELVKLVHISCPLKVIIGYSPCDERGPGGLEEQRLEYAAELMSKVDAFKNTSEDEYVVILGNSKRKNRSNPGYDSFAYRGYVYREGHFCRLEQS